MNAAEQVRMLADGNHMPLLGLGVWQVPDGPECENAVRWALELGYRHIDTAQAYGNEESVGRALRDSGVPREEVFLTTKFYPARSDPEAEAERSLERLGVEQVDLYIIHWPQGGPTWAWPGMEAAHEPATPARSECRTSASRSSSRSWRWRPRRRWSTRCSSARSSTGAALLEACEAARGRARGLQPAGHRAPPRPPHGQRRSPSASGGRRPRCCFAGACSAAPS